MFSTANANDSTILRLLVKGSDLDPLALRGSMASILNDVSLQPRLPPSATLFIRKLTDPLPGSLQLDTSFPRAPQAWRHAFNTKFDRLVSSAARPAFGPVADSAESVVFYDYAELLASLSADWCSGSVMTRWWWQSLLKRGDIAHLIKQLWRDKIEYAPAALQHLVKRNAVVEFVRRLSEAEARALVRRVVQVFALHALRRVVEPRITRIEETDLVVEVREVEKELPVRSVMPWKDVVPESNTPQLQAAQQLFVGITLMIQRAPATVRTLSFARDVECWMEQAIVEPSAVRDPVIVAVPTTTLDSFDRPETHAPIRVNQPAAPPVPLAPETPGKKSASSVAPVFKFEDAQTVLQATTEPIVVNEPTQVVRDEPPADVTPPETLLMTASEALDTITIETELGGLFYLINLATFMEIYSDFTSPVEQFHDDLTIWDFVMIVGREINGDRDLDDPIWTGLQDLQDVQDKNPENPVNPVPKPTWLANLLPDIGARLVLALGITNDDDLAELLLHHHARVIVTPTHLDIFFALATHPIEIRFAGLDRDPGWVPAAGRFIAFHYD